MSEVRHETGTQGLTAVMLGWFVRHIVGQAGKNHVLSCLQIFERFTKGSGEAERLSKIYLSKSISTKQEDNLPHPPKKAFLPVR